MKRKIKNYVVSCANWEFDVDDFDPKSAAISSMILAFKSFGENLLISTTIMVTNKDDFSNGIMHNSDFFLCSSILKELGFEDLSISLNQYTESLNEFKNIKK